MGVLPMTLAAPVLGPVVFYAGPTACAVFSRREAHRAWPALPRGQSFTDCYTMADGQLVRIVTVLDRHGAYVCHWWTDGSDIQGDCLK
jgi:hypothetical protein